jgi:ribA/ribD-fused uncharacterized protein
MLPEDLETLRRAAAGGEDFEYRFFWGHTAPAAEVSDAVFSQWYPSRFEVDGVPYATAEQFMMASKARLFGDDDTLEKILAAQSPAECKKLGRQVCPFDEEAWARVRFEQVVLGNLAKFGQSPMLRAHLMSTGSAILVEAAPRDTIWGIGLGRDNPKAQNPLTWRGENLLGFALVKTRRLLAEVAPVPS